MISFSLQQNLSDNWSTGILDLDPEGLGPTKSDAQTAALFEILL